MSRKCPIHQRWAYTQQFRRYREGEEFEDPPPPEESESGIKIEGDFEVRAFAGGPHFYIERDTPIIGGVWGSHVRENLYVPDHPFLSEMCDTIELYANSENEIDIVDKAFDQVKRLFRKRGKRRRHAQRIKAGLVGYYRNKPHVSVWKFVEKGTGNCRHKALILAALLECLQQRGYLDGRISVDRNRGAHYGGRGHAWARYTDTQGTIWILDPAKNVNEALENTYDDASWAYWRPGDWSYLNQYQQERIRYRDLR